MGCMGCGMLWGMNLASGKRLQFANWKPWPIEIVDLAIENIDSMVIFYRFLYVYQAG